MHYHLSVIQIIFSYEQLIQQRRCLSLEVSRGIVYHAVYLK